MDARQELAELRRLEQLEAKASAPAPAPTPTPAGMTYAGLPGRMQTDVAQGMTPTQVGGSLMLDTTLKLGEWIADGVGKITPQVAKDWFKYEFGSAVDAMPKGFVKAASEGIESVQQWMANNPGKARGLEALMMAGSVTAPATRGAMKAASRRQAMDNSVMPYMNSKNVGLLLDEGRIKPGGGVDAKGWGIGKGKIVFVDTPDVKAQKKALDTVEGFAPYQTNIQRFDLVDKEIIKSSKVLQENLDSLGKTRKGLVTKDKLARAFGKGSVRARFNKGLRPHQFMTDAEYEKIARDLRYSIRKNRADGAVNVGEIHRQRKLLDQQYRAAKGERRLQGVLNPTRDEIMWRTERDILNRLIDSTAPATKAERARLKHLYDVRENLHLKTTKGELYFYKDIANKVPFMGDSKVKLLPQVGGK